MRLQLGLVDLVVVPVPARETIHHQSRGYQAPSS